MAQEKIGTGWNKKVQIISRMAAGSTFGPVCQWCGVRRKKGLQMEIHIQQHVATDCTELIIEAIKEVKEQPQTEEPSRKGKLGFRVRRLREL